MAIDRQTLVDTLWSGYAKVPNGHQFESYGDLYIEDYPGVQYDPEKARELVKESGYDGEEVISIEMADGYYTNGNQAGEAIVSMLADIGVKAEVVFTDKFSFSADIRACPLLPGLIIPLVHYGSCLEQAPDRQTRKQEAGHLQRNLWQQEIH